MFKRAQNYQDARLLLLALVVLAPCSAFFFLLLLMGAGMENETPPGVVVGLIISLVLFVAGVAGLWAIRRPAPPKEPHRHSPAP